MGRIIEACISKSALKHNLQRVRQIAPNQKIIAMIKANGYGHGSFMVANALSQGVDAFGVAGIEAAMKLREQGIQNDILLMEGCFHAEELAWVQRHHFSQVLHAPHQLLYLKEYKGEIQHPFRVWVKVNTGMNRLGFACAQVDAIRNELNDMKHVELIGFMTHFPIADETDNLFTLEQQAQFDEMLKSQKCQRSLANSAGILAWPDSHGDWVRPGLMLYGASPFPGKIGKNHDLKPVMTLQAELIAIREVQKDEFVGYGGKWVCDKKTAKVGIVGIGYGDGYPWHAKNGTPVLINGKQAPLVGRVSMDMIAIDLSDVANPKVGDKVTLWGNGLPVEKIANAAGTIPYELFCRLTPRVKMVGVD